MSIIRLMLLLTSFTVLITGCSSINNTSSAEYKQMVKLSKNPRNAIGELDKFDKIVLVIKNKEVKEVSYSYLVERDAPPKEFTTKRNTDDCFILTVDHPASGIVINADGYSKEMYRKTPEGLVSLTRQLLPSPFGGIIETSLKPIQAD
jgi:hypothetical protein